MHKPVNKSDPIYLAQLGTHEGLAIAHELYRTNQTEIDAGQQLTVAQYKFLLKQVTDRLTKTGEIPSLKTLPPRRYQEFEHAFYSTIRHEGLLL